MMASSPSRLSASLHRFRLDDIRDTGITVGDGAYSTVLQYDFRGLKCVGKKIHRLLYEHASPAQRADMLRRFEEECELLGRLHHPNIVQFLGVHVERGSELPVLVMEYLPTNVSDYLDRHGVLPAEISYGILRDVALGLRYLHDYSPSIVHRDLSANNVLLTASLSAKIADLGVAKILNITPGSQMTQQMSTKAPGTPCYMPPEALLARPRYTRKIDSYSFGVLVLHVLCGEWPFPTDPFQCDPCNASTLVPITEVDRRLQFMQQMGIDHPLSGLVRQCLSNTPHQRPECLDILQQVNTALSRVAAPAETVFQQLEGFRNEVQRLGTDIQRLRSVNQRLEDENQRLRNENGSLRSENQSLREHFQIRPTSSGAAATSPLIHEAERLSVCGSDQPASNSMEFQLHPGVRLQWRKCADAPVRMNRAQVVVEGDKVYMGGGATTPIDDANQVFQYSVRGNTWSNLPRCPVQLFGLAHFMGRIVTVGGGDLQNSLTGKVYALREESQQWEEFLTPMPTARYGLSVATTSVAIIAAGGNTSDAVLSRSSTVELYSSDTSQWHTADPLPIPCAGMSSVTINNICYLLGGHDQSDAIKNCLCVSLPTLVHRAVSLASHSGSGPVWNHLPPTPLKVSSASSVTGSLMAVGGVTAGKTRYVHAFLNNSWMRLRNGDLLSPLSSCATAQLSPVEVIVIGGLDEQHKRSKTVFIGTLYS